MKDCPAKSSDRDQDFSQKKAAVAIKPEGSKFVNSKPEG